MYYFSNVASLYIFVANDVWRNLYIFKVCAILKVVCRSCSNVPCAVRDNDT